MPSVLIQHERTEVSPGNPTVRIFGLGYIAKLIRGEPILSDSHTELLWLNKSTFKPEEYFTEAGSAQRSSRL